MPIISLIIVLCVVGVLLWLINEYVPMDAMIKRIINIVVIIAIVLWLLQSFGLLDGLYSARVGSYSHSNAPVTPLIAPNR